MLSSKEALNLLFCTSEGLPEHKVYECQKILQQELDLLAKYKRAFEIFKRLNGEHLPIFKGTGIITTEEAELLEELMKSE